MSFGDAETTGGVVLGQLARHCFHFPVLAVTGSCTDEKHGEGPCSPALNSVEMSVVAAEMSLAQGFILFLA